MKSLKILLFFIFICKCHKDVKSEYKDIAAEQLINYVSKQKTKIRCPFATNEAGIPMPSLTASETVGENGPITLSDTNLIDHLAHFNRKNGPERIVHAKGGGAFGTFEVLNDVTAYTKASVFSKVGKKTPIFMRFSTATGQSGAPDTTRDSRGFAVKFYTEEGNFDIVGINFPMFWFNDPMLFPSLIRCVRRNPVYNLFDKNYFYDFLTLRHEGAHAYTYLVSDRGIPDGFRHMNGYGVHTYTMVNANGERFYVKFIEKTEQGVKNLAPSNATILTGIDPDYSLKDLYNAIATKNFPVWKLYIKVMTMEQAANSTFNPFDLTKVWPNKMYPPILVGKLTLTENPTNYYNTVNQAAFAPGNLVPGIETSNDRMLTGRIIAYPDSQRRRIGVNFNQLPINKGKIICDKIKHYHRGGMAHSEPNLIMESGPNYYPNTFGGPEIDPKAAWSSNKICGEVARTDWVEDNYSQAASLWLDVFKSDEKKRVAFTIADQLRSTSDPTLVDRLLDLLKKINDQYHDMVKEEIAKLPRLPNGAFVNEF